MTSPPPHHQETSARKTPPWGKGVYWVIISALLILSIAITAYTNRRDRFENDRPIYSITAEQLHQEYADNEIAADRKFKGAWFQINGTVDAIETDEKGNNVIRIRAGSMDIVHAFLRDDQLNAASMLRRGGEVTVTCKGAGRATTEAVLGHCRIIK